MGTAGFGSPRLTAFNRDVNPKGLELVKCDIQKELGVFKAEPNATIRAGQWVKLDANQFVVPVTAAADIPLGIAKWNKQQFGRSVIVHEALKVVFGGTTVLSRAPFGQTFAAAPDAVGIRAAPDVSTALLAAGTVTITTPNVVDWGATGPAGSTDGDTVYATYAYELTDSDLDLDGRDFRNQSNNDVLGQDDRITVITDWSMITTTEYDPFAVYSPTGANSLLRLDAEGRVTTAGAGTIVGRVFQPPAAGGGENVFMTYIASPGI